MYVCIEGSGLIGRQKQLPRTAPIGPQPRHIAQQRRLEAAPTTMRLVLRLTLLFSATILISLVCLIRFHPTDHLLLSVSSTNSSRGAEELPVGRVSVRIKDGEAVPAGSHVRLNLTTGERELVLPVDTPSAAALAIIENGGRVEKRQAPPKPLPMQQKLVRPSKKWRKRFAGKRDHVEALLSALTSDSLQALEEEAHASDVGAGIFHSDKLPSLIALLQSPEADTRLKVLEVLQASLHNNEVALMRAEELRLMDALVPHLRLESDKSVVRKAVFVLHSLLCHEVIGIREDGSMGPPLYTVLRSAFDANSGPAALVGQIDERVDELAVEKAVDILLSMDRPEQAKAVLGRAGMNDFGVERLCETHLQYADLLGCHDLQK